MGSAKSTPGPWIVRRADPTAEDYEDCEFAIERPREGRSPLPIAFVADRALSVMSDANAKLIAAAPALEDALDNLVKIIREYVIALKTTRVTSSNPPRGVSLREVAAEVAVRLAEADAALRAAGRLGGEK